MISKALTPQMELLSQEYVLVQAWKKTSAYIRYHNWYSDTLELDRTTINLPQFLGDLAEQLTKPELWESDPLRIVPAPKSQKWWVNADKEWAPQKDQVGGQGSRLRPLAHVSLRDQVAATAIMLCLADRVEALQGSPLELVSSKEGRQRVLSYGNRLLCDKDGTNMHHRWGSGNLYRAYYQDYRTFISRPEMVAESHPVMEGRRTVVVQSDLRQFYDRVRPALLAAKLDALVQPEDDPRFYAFAKQILNWHWADKDAKEVVGYASQAGMDDFTQVALPQGLVAAGFFANVVLLHLDDALRCSFQQEVCPGILLLDACRYVDDLRLVVDVEQGVELKEVKGSLFLWLKTLLNEHAPGLEPSEKKTQVAMFSGDERPLVRQGRKMARIQSAVSGGFDAIGGEEILDAVLGLVQTQSRFGEERVGDNGWALSPVPDVQDATVARFAAGRFRSTFRSLRPLLQELFEEPAPLRDLPGDEVGFRSRQPRSQVELDGDAKTFALGLIETWVHDPSNVRLLRVALDIWPEKEVLKRVLDLLRPFTEKSGRRKAPRRVAWYCLAELFRAGATETGIVESPESLPKGVDLEGYRSVLRREAIRVISTTDTQLPWYLKQQALLFIATLAPEQMADVNLGRGAETGHYRELIQFMTGRKRPETNASFATAAILARRSFVGPEVSSALSAPSLTARGAEMVAERDPSFAVELLKERTDLATSLAPRLRYDLCLGSKPLEDGWVRLSDVVLRDGMVNRLRNEIGLLQFGSMFLDKLLACEEEVEVITPSEVLLRLEGKAVGGVEVRLELSRVNPQGSLYACPKWALATERWRFQLGYLLRFILTAREDFTKVVRWKEWKPGKGYRAPDSHWFQRIYGFFNGQAAFGDDWLPITNWVEEFLSALLQWPGSLTTESMSAVQTGAKTTLEIIQNRLGFLTRMQGIHTEPMILQVHAPWPTREQGGPRPLRACVVQLVPPAIDGADLTATDPGTRKQHQNHISSALAAIERMLDLRETHKGRKGRLDWLILPELSVHPDDVKTHLIPFARTHKTIILAGLSYQDLGLSSGLLVNSALWIIPEWSESHGLRIVTRRQGKWNLAPLEEAFNQPVPRIGKFRPCQWLIGYEWSGDKDQRPLWLTASICYDATDLSLAARLREHSDVYAISALNKDVGTFDQMSLALHYHMFQMVIVANNGKYGGSSAYAPYKEPYKRQVFHLHGQPQASVAFLEIDPVAEFVNRTTDARKPTIPSLQEPSGTRWKTPPAGIDDTQP